MKDGRRATCLLHQRDSPIEPAGRGRGQTVRAAAGEAGGGEGALRGGADEEGAAAGRPGRPTAAIGTGRTWVSAGQSRWAGPWERGRANAHSVKGERSSGVEFTDSSGQTQASK